MLCFLRNNPITISLILISIVIALFFNGCSSCSYEKLEAHAPNGKELEHDRFHIVEGDYGSEAILVDTETGVEYLWKRHGYAGGLTVLVDRDGKPLRAPGFKDLQ
jgi:hypothetical protein